MGCGGKKAWEMLCAEAVHSCVLDLTLQSRWELNSRGKSSCRSRQGRPEGNKLCCLQTLLKMPFPQHISPLRVSSKSSLPCSLPCAAPDGDTARATSCTPQSSQGKKCCEQGQRLFLPPLHRRNSPELKPIAKIKA